MKFPIYYEKIRGDANGYEITDANGDLIGTVYADASKVKEVVDAVNNGTKKVKELLNDFYGSFNGKMFSSET